jgi:hypothetical protein
VDKVLLVRTPENAQDEAAYRVGGPRAVMPELLPGLVLGDALIHAIRLDQAPERLAREAACLDRRPELAHHRPGGRALAVAEVELTLELVEHGEPVARPLVAEDVDEPCEAVDGA